MQHQEHFEETSLKGIQHLLSLLQSDMITLEASYSQVLLVLRNLDCDAEISSSIFSNWDSLLQKCRRIEQSLGVELVTVREPASTHEVLDSLFTNFKKIS